MGLHPTLKEMIQVTAGAQKLKQTGVEATLQRRRGMVHGFLQMGGLIDDGRLALEEIGNTLRSLFGHNKHYPCSLLYWKRLKGVEHHIDGCKKSGQKAGFHRCDAKVIGLILGV